MANDPRRVSFIDCSKGVEDYACRLKMQEEAEAVGRIRPEDLASKPAAEAKAPPVAAPSPGTAAGIKTPPITAPPPGHVAAESSAGRPVTAGLPSETVRAIGGAKMKDEMRGDGNMPKVCLAEGHEKASSKTGMFEMKVGSEVVAMLDQKLRLQVDVAFERQHAFMLRNGLDSSATIFDVGTGNGYFVGCLARQHSKIRFVGIDYKDYMIQKARKTARELGIENIEWIIGDVSGDILNGMENHFDGILMRYTDIHMPHVARTMGLLTRALKPGGRIWIFSVELDNMHSEPQYPGYEVYIRGTKKLYETLGMDAHLGSKMPVILESLGYELIVSEPDTMSNREMGTEAFQRFMIDQAIVWSKYDPTSFSPNDIEIIKAFARDVVPSPNFYGTHGVVMISAVKGK